MYNFIQLGWNEFFEKQFQAYKNQRLVPARVAAENKQRYILFTEGGEMTGEVTGKLLYSSETSAELPKTGDWVTVAIFEKEKKAIIHTVLERKSKLSRNAADRKTEEQIIATNIDLVFVVQGLDNNFNLRRLERYVVSILESRAEPIIVLNKIDLVEEPAVIKEKVKEIIPGVQIILTNAIKGIGITNIKNILKVGQTGVFTGSSGVGKSSIINFLLGEQILRTNEVSNSVHKGKHTTARREMLIIPGGGIVIDTPGMREFQLWKAESGLNKIFDDIESIALKCRFTDCTHTSEKGCAVINALEEGIINQEKLNSYRKLQKEMDYLEEKQSKSAFLRRKEKEKKLHREIRQINKRRKNRGI